MTKAQTIAPCKITEVDQPRYLVDVPPGYFSNGNIVMIAIYRMDGLPAVDRFGEPLRSDRENWLNRQQAINRVLEILDGLSQYGQAVEAEEQENIDRFHEEFGWEIAQANRR